MTDETMTITAQNAAGEVPFTVRILRDGDTYGLDRCLTHDGGRASVEFYDLRHMHTPLGQFVSRYFVDTILEPPHAGLDLMGYEPSWKIDAAAMRVVRAWLQHQTTEAQR